MSDVNRRDLLALGLPAALPVLGAPATAEGAGFPLRTLVLPATPEFPNSAFPALIYPKALPAGADLGDRFEALFAKHGWSGSWRNGLYRTHHYHSTAHEVLGVLRGNVTVRLGGPGGHSVELAAGDVAVIPAGVAHRNEQQSDDFSVMGAYPDGTGPDMQYGKPGERPGTDKTIARLAIPKLDPVFGATGGLSKLWRRA